MISFPLTAEYVWPKHNFFLTGESSLHMQDHIEFCHTLHTRPFPCNVRIPFLVHVVEISFSPKYFCNSVIFLFDVSSFWQPCLPEKFSCVKQSHVQYRKWNHMCTILYMYMQLWDTLGNREALWIPSTEISHLQRRIGLDRRSFTLNSRGTLRILLS